MSTTPQVLWDDELKKKPAQVPPQVRWDDEQLPPPAEPGRFRQGLAAVGETLGDVAAGAGKGLVHTGTTVLGGVARPVAKLLGGDIQAGDEASRKVGEFTTPQNTAQKIGYYGEQAGEFLVPGGAEEKAGALAARLLPKTRLAAPAARLAAGTLSSGAINKAQGGDFGSGALAGGIAGGVGEVGRAAAPVIAESALGITKRLRGFGKTPGKAAIEEIGGVTPNAVAQNARAKLTELTSELEQHAARSTVPTTTAPAVQVVDREMAKAQARNSKALYDQLQGIRDQLTTDAFSGQPLASAMPASKLLDLKRGIGDLEKTWNPEQKGALKGLVRQVYSALDRELDRAVPASKELNQRISSLIPVAERAASTERGAELGQRVLHRVAAHTGALTGAMGGGYLGYRHGGAAEIPIGAAAGLLLPELIASPTAQMTAARTLRWPLPARLARGLGAQATDRLEQ